MTEPADTESLCRDLRAAIGFPGGRRTADTWGIARDGRLLRRVADALAAPARLSSPTIVVGVEAAGFVFGGAVATSLGIGFVPIRRGERARLPGECWEHAGGVDYRGNRHLLRLQRHACRPGTRALVVDDWAETGSHLLAVKSLLEQAGVEPVGFSVIVDELALNVREAVSPYSFLVRAASLHAPAEPSCGA